MPDQPEIMIRSPLTSLSKRWELVSHGGTAIYDDFWLMVDHLAERYDRQSFEHEATLRDLSDPELISVWAQARQRLALGKGSRANYEAARAEYDRRIGTAS